MRRKSCCTHVCFFFFFPIFIFDTIKPIHSLTGVHLTPESPIMTSSTCRRCPTLHSLSISYHRALLSIGGHHQTFSDDPGASSGTHVAGTTPLWPPPSRGRRRSATCMRVGLSLIKSASGRVQSVYIRVYVIESGRPDQVDLWVGLSWTRV